MNIKKLQKWLDQNCPTVDIEREGKNTILAFDRETQTPIRFKTVNDAVRYYGMDREWAKKHLEVLT